MWELTDTNIFTAQNFAKLEPLKKFFCQHRLYQNLSKSDKKYVGQISFYAFKWNLVFHWTNFREIRTRWTALHDGLLWRLLSDWGEMVENAGRFHVRSSARYGFHFVGCQKVGYLSGIMRRCSVLDLIKIVQEMCTVRVEIHLSHQVKSDSMSQFSRHFCWLKCLYITADQISWKSDKRVSWRFCVTDGRSWCHREGALLLHFVKDIWRSQWNASRSVFLVDFVVSWSALRENVLTTSFCHFAAASGQDGASFKVRCWVVPLIMKVWILQFGSRTLSSYMTIPTAVETQEWLVVAFWMVVHDPHQ